MPSVCRSCRAVVTLQERGAIRTAASAFGWDREQIRLLREKLKAGRAHLTGTSRWW